MKYRVTAIPESVTSRVRADMRDPIYKHPAHLETATGYGPCRQCLQFFAAGTEKRILFTYDAFLGLDEFRQPGPVFIHERECAPYPETSAFPSHLASHSLTFEAYGKGKDLRATARVSDGIVEPAIDRLLSLPNVDYIIVRDTDAGCFDCAILPS